VGAERVDERRGIGAEAGRGKARLEQRLTVVQRAELERQRARIDAGDARAQPSSFATA
jgi:hypothetical protein